MQGAALDDLVAADWDDYVAKAVALADDPEALDALRDRARAGFDSAPYTDERAMTERLEDVYRTLFGRWSRARSQSARAA